MMLKNSSFFLFKFYTAIIGEYYTRLFECIDQQSHRCRYRFPPLFNSCDGVAGHLRNFLKLRPAPIEKGAGGAALGCGNLFTCVLGHFSPYGLN